MGNSLSSGIGSNDAYHYKRDIKSPAISTDFVYGSATQTFLGKIRDV